MSDGGPASAMPRAHNFVDALRSRAERATSLNDRLARVLVSINGHVEPPSVAKDQAIVSPNFFASGEDKADKIQGELNRLENFIDILESLFPTSREVGTR